VLLELDPAIPKTSKSLTCEYKDPMGMENKLAIEFAYTIEAK
jgi:hypothetical protein